MDKNKTSNAGVEYLIWKANLELKSDIIFVSEDLKSDWIDKNISLYKRLKA